MSNSEEVPADQPEQQTQPAQAAEPTQAIETQQPTQVVEQAQAVPAAEPTQEIQGAPVAQAVPDAPPAPEPTPEELAAAAEKKAKRRMVFAKTTVLTIPALALVALLIGSGIEVNSAVTKTQAASTAADSGNVAVGLAAQLQTAQSAAQGSILVDAGCIAAESTATANLGNKMYADIDALGKAENGTSLSAVTNAADKYIDDLQSLQTNLQQDAALTSRANVKSALGALSGDLGSQISSWQQLLDGDYSDSLQHSLDDSADRMETDGTAVDTLCGGTTLGGGGAGSSSDSGGGSGSTSA